MGRNAAEYSGYGTGAGLSWLWNYYVFARGHGPEMTPELAVLFAATLGKAFDRIAAILERRRQERAAVRVEARSLPSEA